jgi:SAM-dependent methyltransferase
MKQTPKVSAHYRGESGARYAAHAGQLVGDHYGYQLNAAFFRPHLGPGSTVLDFGCGNGAMLRALQPWVGRIDGLEVNPHARALAASSGAVIYAALDEIPATTLYDAVVSNHVLEHVRDVPGTLEIIRAHLRPGGLLCVLLPVDDFRAARQSRWDRNDADRHLQTWTPRLFANTLFEAGYDEVLECRVLTYVWHDRLFPLYRFLGRAHHAVAWALAVALRRRQLWAVARVGAA